MPASTLGCGEYSGLAKMFARLLISGPWHLAKFKDDLTDDDEREELEEAVEPVLRPLLERCNSASISAKIDKTAHLLNEMIPPELAPARPRGGDKCPKPTPRQRTASEPGDVSPEKSDLGGPARAKRPPRDELQITFDGVAADDGIGSFQKGSRRQPHRVSLSPDDPMIASLLAQRDEGLASRCLLAVSLMLFEHEMERSRPELLERMVPFGFRISKHLLAQEHVKESSSA